MSGKPSLNERLGYAASDRNLIVNCDDLGSSHAANVAAEAGMRYGLGTSATLMVPCPWAREAVENCPDLDIGVHLTLTAEYPGYRWRALTAAPSLHDAEGYMPFTPQEVWAKADLADVEAECRAQIEQAYDWGLDITHLDVHMGTLQIEPRYFAIYLKLAVEFDLPMRMAGASAQKQIGFPYREPALAAGRFFPDNFLFQWQRPTRELLLERLPRLSPGVTELCVHPVEDGPELRGYDKTNAEIRVGDHACLFDEELKSIVAREGIRLIGFKPLRDLQRADKPVLSRN